MNRPGSPFDPPSPSLPLGRLLLLILLALLCVKGCESPADRSADEEAMLEEGADAAGDSLSADTAGEPADDAALHAEPPLPAAPAEGELPLWADPAYLAEQRDTALARVIGQLLERHHPDGAIWLMADGSTNELLAWGQYNDSALQRRPDYASRATFPAASVAKTVTAAAAFESGRFSPSSAFPLVGRAHTLYNRQLKVKEGQGTPISVSHAFARSMNPPMALLGMRTGAPALRESARKFGFGVATADGLPTPSRYVAPDSGYALAEVSCGFTQSTTLSPAQAAGMAYSVLTGRPWTPAWAPRSPEGGFPRRPLSPVPAHKPSTLRDLRALFEETATSGTARKSLRKTIFSNWRDRLVVGGKTGSLDGSDPQGRYDWFVGYAYDREDPKKSVVVVVMQYHRRLRSLPASQVTGVLLNYWAKYYLDAKKPSRAPGKNAKKRG